MRVDNVVIFINVDTTLYHRYKINTLYKYSLNDDVFYYNERRRICDMYSINICIFIRMCKQIKISRRMYAA